MAGSKDDQLQPDAAGDDRPWHTGDIVARETRPTGEFLTGALTLPTAFWKELTAHLASFDRDARDVANLDDMALEERIALFLDMEVAGWEARPDVTLNHTGEPDDPLT